MQRLVEDLSEAELIQELAKRRKSSPLSLQEDINLLDAESLKNLREANFFHMLKKKTKIDLMDISIKHLQIVNQ